VLQLSYGTRLPAVDWTPAWVEVLAVDGRHVYVRRSAVALHRPGAAWPRVRGADLVREAERFLGLEYIWGGTAGFGYDCSGLTYAVHHALDRTIPRDAGPQGARGERIVTREALRPGDLVFFRDGSGRVHHVGMYVGDGKMIHAPRTGEAVSITAIDAEPYSSEFAGGRRYWR
jgi:cell wall-associated NlpC family hydrolase